MKARKKVKGEGSEPQQRHVNTSPIQPIVPPDVQAEVQHDVQPEAQPTEQPKEKIEERTEDRIEERIDERPKRQPESQVPIPPRKLEAPRVNKRSAKSRLVIIAVILGTIGIVIGGMFTYQYMISPERMAKKAAAKNAALIEEVRSHMLLPENETPVIYEVQDPELLSAQQPFFKGAEAGDSLIVFPQSAKAIIYSSKRGLIVNVGPVSFDESSLQKR